MTRDRSDATTVRYDPLRGPERKAVFEPNHDGTFERETYLWTGCSWHFEGAETVANLRISVSQPTVGNVVVVRDQAGGQTVRGPEEARR